MYQFWFALVMGISNDYALASYLLGFTNQFCLYQTNYVYFPVSRIKATVDPSIKFNIEAFLISFQVGCLRNECFCQPSYIYRTFIHISKKKKELLSHFSANIFSFFFGMQGLYYGIQATFKVSEMTKRRE